MKIAVVDDEQQYRNDLLGFINDYLKEKHLEAEVYDFSNAESFLQGEVKPEEYSLIFMDIYMEGISGIEAMEQFKGETSKTLLIFCTTSQDHMPDAFKLHAFEYVIKPAEKDRIFKVMDDALKTLPRMEKYFNIVNKGSKVYVLFSEFIYATTNGHYIEVHTKRDTYQIRYTMDDFIPLLQNDERFLRINRGIMVNMDYITKISGTDCLLNNGETLPIRIRSASEMADKWHDYTFKKMRDMQNRLTERR